MARRKMERDLAALKLDITVHDRIPEKSMARKIYEENLNQNIKFTEKSQEILDRTINNLKRLNLSADYSEMVEISLENLKIKDHISPQQQDPNTWNLKKLTLQ